MTRAEMHDKATELYRRHYAALAEGDTEAAARLKTRADYLNIAGVTGHRIPWAEAMALTDEVR